MNFLKEITEEIETQIKQNQRDFLLLKLDNLCKAVTRQKRAMTEFEMMYFDFIEGKL